MPLDITYTDEFERVWKVWLEVPKPHTRNNKALGYRAWQSAMKLMKFTQSDVESIVDNIREQARWNADWVVEHGKFVPAFSTYCNQRRWNENYRRVKSSESPPQQAPNQQLAKRQEIQWWHKLLQNNPEDKRLKHMPEWVREAIAEVEKRCAT